MCAPTIYTARQTATLVSLRLVEGPKRAEKRLRSRRGTHMLAHQEPAHWSPLCCLSPHTIKRVCFPLSNYPPPYSGKPTLKHALKCGRSSHHVGGVYIQAFDEIVRTFYKQQTETQRSSIASRQVPICMYNTFSAKLCSQTQL